MGGGEEGDECTLILLFLKDIEKVCFKRCIKKPGTSLESKDQVCLSKCMDRFMDTWNLVSQAIMIMQNQVIEQSGENK